MLDTKLWEFNQDFDFVTILLEKINIRKKRKDRLERKFNIHRKRLSIVKEEAKQRIKPVAAKIKRLYYRINQYQQNWMFVNNQG